MACPGFAAVGAGEEVAVVGGTENLVGRVGVYGDLEHSAGGRVADVDALPGFAGVLAAEEGAGLWSAGGSAAAAGAGAEVDGSRVVGGYQQVAAV